MIPPSTSTMEVSASYHTGGILPSINFGGQNFVTRDSHQIYTDRFEKPTKIFGTKFVQCEICTLRNFTATKLEEHPPPLSWAFFFTYRGGFCPGKLNLGKILSEISGQYFYQGFKPDRIFPTVFKKSRKVQFHLVVVLKI